MKNEIDLNQEALRFYSDIPPSLKLSVAVPPVSGRIALGDVLQGTIEELQRDMGRSLQFARTFGKLRVGINTGGLAVRARLTSVDSKEGQFMELRTKFPVSLLDCFSYPDIDAGITYAIDNSLSRTELQLIKALHMLDASLITGQFDGRLPTVVCVDSEELLKLRADNPKLLLRGYGNVRRLQDAPELLGMVLPTSTLEQSGVSYLQLDEPTSDFDTSSPSDTLSRLTLCSREALVGITTAKTPHAGHLALLMKAFSCAEEQVVVELNDSGPRVAAAVGVLAMQRSLPAEKVIDLITNGEISRGEIESAYKLRDTVTQVPELGSGFQLLDSNRYYQRILGAIAPIAKSIVTLTDGQMPREDISQPIFDGSVSVVQDTSGCVVTRMAGELTAKGLFLGIFIDRMGITMIDSPPLFSRVELSILKNQGIEIITSEGAGVMFDFNVASGTAGNSPSVESCIDVISRSGLESNRLLEVFRRVATKSVLIRNPDGSTLVNFKDGPTLLTRLSEEARMLQQEDVTEDINAPLVMRPASPVLLATVLENIGATKCKKLSLDNIREIASRTPALLECLSEPLRAFVLSSAVTMPKSVKHVSDSNFLGGLTAGKGDELVRLLEAQLAYDQKNNTDITATLLSGSELANRLRFMGYEQTDIGAISQIIANKSTRSFIL